MTYRWRAHLHRADRCPAPYWCILPTELAYRLHVPTKASHERRSANQAHIDRILPWYDQDMRDMDFDDIFARW